MASEPYPKKTFQPAVDDAKITPASAQRIKEAERQGLRPASYSGVFCTPRPQPLAQYIPRDDETIYSNPQGSYICMGSDNLGDRTSGYGGAGETRTSKIDLVCGRNGSNSWVEQSVDPLPYGDAARIYISEKTDCDSNFNLADGTIGRQYAKSAVVLKADGIRIIGREGVKIVSGIGTKGESNALGGAITKRGIDLIAGNVDEAPHQMQPLVKGENLKKALLSIAQDTSMILAQVNNFIQYQLEFNSHIMSHAHISPFLGSPTTLPPTMIGPTQQFAKKAAGEMMPDLLKIKVNIEGHLASTYLTPGTEDYILSQYNNTN